MVIPVDAVEDDAETGLYYLRNRYYDPVWGRFLNWDSLLGVTGGLFTHNAFCYCFNNPVKKTDSTGLLPFYITEISKIPVEKLPYMAHKLAGEPYDEIMTTEKYSTETGSRAGKIYLPNGKEISIEYSGLRNTYHVDVWIDSAGRDILKELGGDKYGAYDPTYPIILELDYKGKKIRTWAVIHLNYKDGHRHFCVWLYNSDWERGGTFGPHRNEYGRDNPEVDKVPAAFGVSPARTVSPTTYRGPNHPMPVPY